MSSFRRTLLAAHGSHTHLELFNDLTGRSWVARTWQVLGCTHLPTG